MLSQLKDSCESIAPVISRLVTNSFQMAAFPKAWKIESNSEEPANNRPISLLPVLSKVCERLAHRQFVEFLTTNYKLSLYQSGNRKMHSTETALINVSDNLLKAIDENQLRYLYCLTCQKLLTVLIMIYCWKNYEDWALKLRQFSGLAAIYLVDIKGCDTKIQFQNCYP